MNKIKRLREKEEGCNQLINSNELKELSRDVLCLFKDIYQQI